jgi:hypothetical protein
MQRIKVKCLSLLTMIKMVKIIKQRPKEIERGRSVELIIKALEIVNVVLFTYLY